MNDTSKGTSQPLQDLGWILLELMGHRQRVGQAKEVEMFGVKLLRIDIPVKPGHPDLLEPVDEDAEYVSEFYGGAAIYAIRPITEQVARDHYALGDPRPARPADYKPSAQIGRPEYEPDDEGEW